MHKKQRNAAVVLVCCGDCAFVLADSENPETSFIHVNRVWAFDIRVYGDLAKHGRKLAI